MGTTFTSIDEREKWLDRYVELEAIETFFERILDPRGSVYVTDLLRSAGLGQKLDERPTALTDLEEELNEVHRMLFPEDEERDKVSRPKGRHPDERAARARANLAAARLFANAAGRSDVFAAEADALIAEATDAG